MMDNSEEILQRLQQTQIEILDCIHEICKKNGIRYSLYAGSLLGAVRHRDFIPWDDDLDICMVRSEYDRFLSIWDDEKHDGLILQNKENSPTFSQSFTKIRKDHTTFLQFDGEQNKGYHTGIFVDVFPLDRMPQGKFRRLLFRYRCLKYQLLTREYIPDNTAKTVQIASKILLALAPKKKRTALRRRLLKKIIKYNGNAGLELVGIETASSLKHPLGTDALAEVTELSFGDKAYTCDANWDVHLKRKYGDYMQLPPKEERVWKHHPILVDFEHNYEEIEE